MAASAGSSGRIVYDHKPSDGGDRLWWSNPDGSDPRAVPFTALDWPAGALIGVGGAEWGPDGRHLVADLTLSCGYGSNCSNEVGYLDTGTGEVRQLTCDGTVPSPFSSAECTTAPEPSVRTATTSSATVTEPSTGV